MKLAQRLLVLLGILAIAVFTLSCESTTEDPEAPEPLPEVTTLGGVAGYVYDASGVVIVDDPANAPGGATAVAGAEVRLQMVTDVDDAETMSDGAGAFDISGLRPGLYSVEVRANPASVQPDFETHVSIVANQTIRLEKTFAVSQSSALDALLAGSPAAGSESVPGSAAAPEDYTDALILGMAQPLPAGVEVHAVSPDGNTLVRKTTADEWFFFVDLVPILLFHHPVEYVFVDATDGSVRRFSGDAQPIVNGVPYWYTDRTYLVYEGDPLASDPNDFSMTATAEIVRTPPVPAIPTSSPAATSAPPATARRTASARTGAPPFLETAAASDNPNDWFTLILGLDKRLDVLRDTDDMDGFFLNQGVPVRNTHVLDSWLHDKDGFKVAYETLHTIISRKVDARVAEGGKPTLFVFIAGHGTDTGLHPARLKDGSLFYRNAGNWDLEEIKACRTVVIWETCHAQVMANDLSLEFETLQPDARPELRVFASCAADEKSQGNPPIHEVLTLGFIRSEGQFTALFRKHASVVNGDIAGVTDASGSYIPEFDPWFTTDYLQSPQIVELYGDPYWCRTLETIIEVDTPSLALALPGPVQSPCNMHVGNLTFHNPTRLDAEVIALPSDPSIKIAPADFALAAGGSRTVAVSYDCTTPPPVIATIRFVATTSNGQKDTVTVDVRITPPLSVGSREITVRAPSPAGVNTYEVIFPLPAGAVVDHTTLIDKATGVPPPLIPWVGEGSFAAFSVVSEGFNDQVPPQWVYEFQVADPPIGNGCLECLPKTWVYTVNFYTGQ